MFIFRKVTAPKGVSKSRPIEYRYEMTKRSEETEKAREGEKEFAHSAETGDPRMQKQINTILFNEIPILCYSMYSTATCILPESRVGFEPWVVN